MTVQRGQTVFLHRNNNDGWSLGTGLYKLCSIILIYKLYNIINKSRKKTKHLLCFAVGTMWGQMELKFLI